MSFSAWAVVPSECLEKSRHSLRGMLLKFDATIGGAIGDYKNSQSRSGSATVFALAAKRPSEGGEVQQRDHSVAVTIKIARIVRIAGRQPERAPKRGEVQ